MSNQIRRSLVRTMFSPASFRRFFGQPPIVVAMQLGYATAAATAILSLCGLNYWMQPDMRRINIMYVTGCRERRRSITADVEMLEREVESIKAKQLHTRVQKEDTKADNPVC